VCVAVRVAIETLRHDFIMALEARTFLTYGRLTHR
jgi:hypothetical protein